MEQEVDPRLTENERRVIAMSDALRALIEGHPGEEFKNIVIDRIDEAVNRLIDAKTEICAVESSSARISSMISLESRISPPMCVKG